MRTLLFFDLPSVTSKDKKHYRDFVKYLKALGFYRLQESVFCKMDIDKQAMDSSIKRIEAKLPPDGSVITLSVTEKQFSTMKILLGDIETDVINSDERIIILWKKYFLSL